MDNLNIIHLFPDLLNLYGDCGNIKVLKKRCELHGIEANVIAYNSSDEIVIDEADIIYLGGGKDSDQKLVCEKLQMINDKLVSYRDSDGVVLAVCGGYQMLGHYTYINGEKIEGLSLCDLYTEQNDDKFIGDIAVKTSFGTVVGFENHGGRTHLGEGVSSFGEVMFGNGNNGADKSEGIIYKNIYGTHLHGPLLPKNPAIADMLISKAYERKYGRELCLAEIDDSMANMAREAVMKENTTAK